MVFNKVLGFIWVLLYLAIISIFGCSQNIVLTISSDKPGAVLLNEEPVEDHLSISRHASVNFNGTDADQVLQTATDVARTTDGPDDVECDITLNRHVSVAEFTNAATPAFIDDWESYDAVAHDNPSDVKVLAGMDWCNRKFQPNVLLGCTGASDSMTVVTDLPINQLAPDDAKRLKGIMWLHEYGHLKGLDHRNDANAVMNEEVEPYNTRLNETECG